MGLPFAEFWTVSLREFGLVVKSHEAQKRAEFDAERVLQQELAHLISYAFHDPAKMPDLTKSKGASASPKGQSADRLWAALRGFQAANQG